MIDSKIEFDRVLSKIKNGSIVKIAITSFILTISTGLLYALIISNALNVISYKITTPNITEDIRRNIENASKSLESIKNIEEYIEIADFAIAEIKKTDFISKLSSRDSFKYKTKTLNSISQRELFQVSAQYNPPDISNSKENGYVSVTSYITHPELDESTEQISFNTTLIFSQNIPVNDFFLDDDIAKLYIGKNSISIKEHDRKVSSFDKIQSLRIDEMSLHLKKSRKIAESIKIRMQENESKSENNIEAIVSSLSSNKAAYYFDIAKRTSIIILFISIISITAKILVSEVAFMNECTKIYLNYISVEYASKNINEHIEYQLRLDSTKNTDEKNKHPSFSIELLSDLMELIKNKTK